MTRHISRRLTPRLALLAGVIAMLSVALMLIASSASASSKYCGGQRLSGGEYCFGVARDVEEVKGYGEEHSVCVGIGAESGHCSGGPHQIATFDKGTVVDEEPWIQDNAAGSTVVYGEAF
jgi:hypothetical protein